MPQLRPQNGCRAKGLVARLDHATRDLNAFLLVLAIGLAVLDLTCFWAMTLRDVLPAGRGASAATVAADPAIMNGFVPVTSAQASQPTTATPRKP
jgi:hypothetical protein